MSAIWDGWPSWQMPEEPEMSAEAEHLARYCSGAGCLSPVQDELHTLLGRLLETSRIRLGPPSMQPVRQSVFYSEMHPPPPPPPEPVVQAIVCIEQPRPQRLPGRVPMSHHWVVWTFAVYGVLAVAVPAAWWCWSIAAVSVLLRLFLTSE